MSELIAVNYDTQTVSARELHEKLRIGTKFTTWFERMCEYGFEDGKEFFPKMGKTSEQGGVVVWKLHCLLWGLLLDMRLQNVINKKKSCFH